MLLDDLWAEKENADFIYSSQEVHFVFANCLNLATGHHIFCFHLNPKLLLLSLLSLLIFMTSEPSDLSNLFTLNFKERWLPDPLASNTKFKNVKYYHKLIISK